MRAILVRGPVTTPVVIALLGLTCEVNSLRWVVGLNFRLFEAKAQFSQSFATTPPNREKEAKNSNRQWTKYTDRMGSLGIHAGAVKSCPLSQPGRHFTKKVNDVV